MIKKTNYNAPKNFKFYASKRELSISRTIGINKKAILSKGGLNLLEVLLGNVSKIIKFQF